MVKFKILDVFNFDPDFQKNEAMYSEIRQEIIGSADENSDEDEEESEGGNENTEFGNVYFK